MSEPRAIKIAINAMGGQGGGVLASWIVTLGELAGYLAQSTSVPGVAQRTGATVYYVELFPEAEATKKGMAPVLALMPASGDVDIVIAAEFMEAGRALMRGFVSERTTIIASSHRDYAIAEKIGMGDARQNGGVIREAVKKAAGRYIEADMAAAAEASGAVISAVMFGALAGSGALPVSRQVFEDTIKSGGRAVDANLRGFAKGFELASTSLQAVAVDTPSERSVSKPAPAPAPAVAPLLERMRDGLPPEIHDTVREGLKRCVDYQDVAYANDYIERLKQITDLDKAHGRGRYYRLSQLAAKHLALWMTYEDVIRVADLKTRASRFDRFRHDVNAEEGQIIAVHEYLHPRVEEVCDILPSSVAPDVLKGTIRRTLLTALLGGGRRVPTTKLRGFLQLWALSKLRFMRRGSFRFAIEQTRIRQWSGWIRQYAPQRYDFACEIAAMQRLIKGYGDTHERGLANYNRIMARIEEIERLPNPAATLAALRDAALKDEDGAALDAALAQLRPGIEAAE